MKLREMTATFGGLEKATLPLGPGLNIISGENEGGKSTWAAFLRAMLYGVPTGQRDKAGFLAEKNRYSPWSGAPAEGTVRLEWEGRELLLRRRTKGVALLGQLEIVDARTGDPVPELTGETVGKTLLGVPREVFERSAFMGQSALAVDAVPALEQRIAGLLDSGLEEVSGSQAQRQLKDWLNRRKHNRTGLIPRLEEELEQGEAVLLRIARARRQREEGLNDLDALRGEKRRLEDEKGLHRLAQRKKAWEQYEAALARWERAREDYDRAAAEKEQLPTGEQLWQGRQALMKLRELTVEWELRGEVLRQLPPPREEPLPPVRGKTVLLSLLVGLAAAALSLVTKHIFFVPVGILTAAGSFFLLQGLRRREHTRRQEAAMVRYRERREELEKELETLEDRRGEALAALLELVRTFAPHVTGEEEAEGALYHTVPAGEGLSSLKEAMDGAKELLELARAALGGETTPPEQGAEPTVPYQEVVGRLAAVAQELSRREQMVAAAEGELCVLGDPDELEARMDEVREELVRRQEEYDAIRLALEGLQEAEQTMRAKFSPALNKKAGEILGELTGGRYGSVILNRELQAQVTEQGEIVPRSSLSLSQGTVDQLYLAVRLAICDLTFSHTQPPPLVLDDALANFDDGRMALALEHLRKRGEQQQILLFTCHSREMAWAKGKEDILCTELK